MPSQRHPFPKKIITHYISRLRKYITVDGVLLFGSFAYGQPTKHSDVDLVISSPDFSSQSFDSRMDFLTQARDRQARQIAMDVIGYTPKELSQAEKFSAILSQAKKKGRWLVPLATA